MCVGIELLDDCYGVIDLAGRIIEPFFDGVVGVDSSEFGGESLEQDAGCGEGFG